MNHKEIGEFIDNLRTRLLNESHTIKEDKGFQACTNIDADKIVIILYKDEPTIIPLITIVWEDGSVSSEHWKDITGLTHEGLKPVYKYCPIKLGDIVPPKLRNEAYKVFQHNQVNLRSY